MSFSSISDENTVDISPIYQNLVNINNRLQIREKWSKFATFVNRNYRKDKANKLCHIEKSFILYKLQMKRKFFNKWKSKHIDKKYKIISNYKNAQKPLSRQKNRNIWKKLSQKLIMKNRYTYLIADVSNLFKFRTMKRCFQYWLQRFSYSPTRLRNQWKYLMVRRLHREVILRIYNVESTVHTRVIWRDFIDRILHKYYLNKIQIVKNKELIRQNWIFLSSEIIHEQNLKRLYQVKSKLKTKAVWQYFMSKILAKYNRSIFTKKQNRYQLKKKKKASIINKWANLFNSFHKYSHQESIKSTRYFLQIRSLWGNLLRKKYFSNLKKSLNEGLAELIRRKERIRQKSALIIQKIFRLHLKHQKEIHDMIFNTISFDSFTEPLFLQATMHFMLPVSLPPKIYNPLINTISSDEAKNNYDLNFFDNETNSIDSSFALKCFSEIGLAELKFFSTDKNFPIPYIDLNSDDFISKEFECKIETNLDLYRKEKVPKFTEKRIQEDVIDSLQVDPEFDVLTDSKVNRFDFNTLKKSEIIEKVLEEESDFKIDDNLESCFSFDDLFIHYQTHLFDFEPRKYQIPRTEAKFGIANLISRSIPDSLELTNEEQQIQRFQTLLPFNLIYSPFNHYKSFYSQFARIRQQHIDRVSSLSFAIDDTLMKKKKRFFASKYSLFQTGIDFLVDERFFIKGFYFTPRISRFIAVDSMINRKPFSDILQITQLNSILLDSNLNFHLAYPINEIIQEKDQICKERSIDILLNEIELDEIQYEPQIDLNNLSFYRAKRTKASKESIQEEFLNSYLNQFEEEEIQMNLIDFGQTLDSSNFKPINICIEKRPCDIIPIYLSQAIDSSIISLQDFQVKIESKISTFSIKDDRSFIDISILDKVSKRIFINGLNRIPLVSNLPSFQTIFEITNGFLSSVPLSPPRLAQSAQNFKYKFQIDGNFNEHYSHRFPSKNKSQIDDIFNENHSKHGKNKSQTDGYFSGHYSHSWQNKSQTDDSFNGHYSHSGKNKSQIDGSFNETHSQRTPNRAKQNFNSDLDIDFNEMLSEISQQFDVDNLEQMEAKDERVIVSSEVIDDLMSSSEESILNIIPLNSNMPQNEMLLELSEDFEFFNETINDFASFGLDNKSLFNYLIIDDRMFYDDKFNDQITLNILRGINLPLVPNVPTDFDIKLIADEFYEFCNINTKVPLSPIKRIEMKDDKSLVMNHEAMSEFSSLLHSIDYPIVNNSPHDNTIDEIASIFYDASDIICYFSSFENLIPLILFETKDDISFTSHKLSDRICFEIFNKETPFPIVLNKADDNEIEQIFIPSIQNIEESVFDSLFFEFNPINLGLNYQRIDDRAFIDNNVVDSLVSSMFNSAFNLNHNIICLNSPDNETITEIADYFVDSEIDSFSSYSLSSLSNIQAKDARVYANQNIIDKVASNLFESIFSENQILCPNLPENETITEIAVSLIDSDVDPFSSYSLLSLSNIQAKDERVYVNHIIIDRVASSLFESIFSENQILCPNLPEKETITEIAVDLIDSDVDPFSTFSLSSLSNIQAKDEQVYVNHIIIDRVASSLFESIFSENQILCPNLPEKETITEIAVDLIDSDVDPFSTFSLSSLSNIQAKDERIYINSRIIDDIISDQFESIFSNEMILCSNLPDDFTVIAISNGFVNTNVNPFSVFDLSSLQNIQLKDQLFYINNHIIDSVISNLFESVFYENKILCSNLPDTETINDITNNLIDFEIDSFSELPITSLSNIQAKDERIYINSRIIDEIISEQFESIFSDEMILCSNLPDELTVIEIADGFVNSKIDSFANANTSSLFNIQSKDQRIYINKNIIDKITSNLFNSIFSDENILYLNVPENEIIDEITYRLADTSVDQFSLIDLSSLSIFQLKDDLAFIDTKSLNFLTTKFITDELNSIPIVSNSANSMLINEITSVPEFHDSFCEYDEFSSFIQILQPIQNFNTIDDKFFCHWKEVDQIVESFIINGNLPLIPNNFTITNSPNFFDFIDFNQVLKNVVSKEFNQKNMRFNRKDDRIYVKNEEIEALYFSMFFDAIDKSPLVKNLPSDDLIREITTSVEISENASNTNDLFNDLNPLIHLSQYEQKESKSLFSKEEADSFCYSILQSIQLPLIENDIDCTIVNDITKLVALRNRVFDLDFDLHQYTNSLNLISPSERRINIDDSFVDDYTEIKINLIINQNLPIVPNNIHNEDVRKMLAFIDFQLKFPCIESNETISPLLDFNPNIRRIKFDIENVQEFDDEDFTESLILKILYEDVLPIIPIRENQNTRTNDNYSETSFLFEDEDYNISN